METTVISKNSSRTTMLMSLIPLMLMFGGCTQQDENWTACGAHDSYELICGVQSPEDLVVTPDGKALLFSEFGGYDGGTGAITAMNLTTQRLTRLYGSRAPEASEASNAIWGDPNCNEPAMLSPAGIDLSQRADGRWQLLAINHYERESVEYFEVLFDQANGGNQIQLIWRGCAVLPGDGLLNDVVALADGFAASQMFTPPAWKAFGSAMLMGRPTGFVWQWSNQVGWKKIPQSDGFLPNGVSVTADLKTLIVNMTMEDTQVFIDLEKGEVIEKIALQKPDNNGWLGQDNVLMLENESSMLKSIVCHLPGTSCNYPFNILQIDPQTRTVKDQRQHVAMNPVAGGSVVVAAGDYYYMGSYSADRILKVKAQSETQ